jgi:hypothetical protein
MIRFTETRKWDDPWFRALSPSAKLLFIFVAENCNNAGFYELDTGAIAFKTGLTEAEIGGALEGLRRGIKGASGWLWLRQFLKHQKNDPLKQENPAHRQIIALLSEQVQRFARCQEFQQSIATYKGLLSPIGIGIGIGTGKGKGTDVHGAEKESNHSGRPNLEEAVSYGRELGLERPAVESWFDHFESNGWKVSGRAPMKDWRAALRNAQRRSAHSGTGPNGTTPKRLKRVD